MGQRNFNKYKKKRYNQTTQQKDSSTTEDTTNASSLKDIQTILNSINNNDVSTREHIATLLSSYQFDENDKAMLSIVQNKIFTQALVSLLNDKLLNIRNSVSYNKKSLRNSVFKTDSNKMDLTEAEGHAVRAVYLYISMSELALKTNDKEFYIKNNKVIDFNVSNDKFFECVSNDVDIVFNVLNISPSYPIFLYSSCAGIRFIPLNF